MKDGRIEIETGDIKIRLRKMGRRIGMYLSMIDKTPWIQKVVDLRICSHVYLTM